MEKCKECGTVMEEKSSNQKYVILFICPKCGWFTFRPDKNSRKV